MFQRYFKESSCFLKWVECSSVFDSLLQKGYNVCLGNFKSGSGKFQGCFKSESRVRVIYYTYLFFSNVAPARVKQGTLQ